MIVTARPRGRPYLSVGADGGGVMAGGALVRVHARRATEKQTQVRRNRRDQHDQREHESGDGTSSWHYRHYGI